MLVWGLLMWWIWIFQLTQTQVFLNAPVPSSSVTIGSTFDALFWSVFGSKNIFFFVLLFYILLLWCKAWLPCCKNTFPELKKKQTMLNTYIFGLSQQFLSLQLIQRELRCIASSIHQGNCQLKSGKIAKEANIFRST